MNHFFIGEGAQDLGDLLGPQPAEALGIRRRIVAQTAGKFCSLGIAQGDDVALAETAGDADYANGQETLAAALDGLAGTVIDDETPLGPRRVPEPALPGRHRCTVRQEERPDRLGSE